MAHSSHSISDGMSEICMNIHCPLTTSLHHHSRMWQPLLWGLPLMALVIPVSVAEARTKNTPPTAAISTPLVAEPMIELARAALDRGQTAAAVTLARQALASQPNDRSARMLLADALLANGEPEPAVPLYRALAAEKPDDTAARSGLGLGLLMLGQDAEAIEVLKGAIANTPSADVVSNIAFTLALAGRAQDAVTLLEPLVKAPTSTVQQRQNLAFALALTGERARAYQIAALDLDIKTALRVVDAWFVDAGQPLPLKLQKYAGLSLKSTPSQSVAITVPKTTQSQPAASIVATATATARAPIPTRTLVASPVPVTAERPAVASIAAPAKSVEKRAITLQLPLVSAPIEVDAPTPNFAAQLASPRSPLATLVRPIQQVHAPVVAVVVPNVAPPVEAEAPTPSFAAQLASPRSPLATLVRPIQQVHAPVVAVAVPNVAPPVEAEAPAPNFAAQLASPRPTLAGFVTPLKLGAPVLSSLTPSPIILANAPSPTIASAPAPVLAAAVQFPLPRPASSPVTFASLGNPRLGQTLANTILQGHARRARADSDLAAYAAIVPAAGTPRVTPTPLFINEATTTQPSPQAPVEQRKPTIPTPLASPPIVARTRLTVAQNNEVVLEPIVFRAHGTVPVPLVHGANVAVAPVPVVNHELILDTVTIIGHSNQHVPTVVATNSSTSSTPVPAEALARIAPASDGTTLLNVLARAQIDGRTPVLDAQNFTRALQGCAQMRANSCQTVLLRF